jgi:hypothetical protein
MSALNNLKGNPEYELPDKNEDTDDVIMWDKNCPSPLLNYHTDRRYTMTPNLLLRCPRSRLTKMNYCPNLGNIFWMLTMKTP